MAERTFTDAELAAWLDGTAPDTLATAIDGALADGDPALETRLAALDPFAAEQGEALTQAFDALLADAPTEKLARALPPEPRPALPTRRLAIAGGLAASIAVAFAGGYRAGIGRETAADEPEGPKLPYWVTYVANYLELYTAETFTGGPTDPYAWRESIALISERIGVDFSGFYHLPGLELRRAQMLDLHGSPLAQLIYLDAENRPLAICVILRDKPPEATRTPLTSAETEAFHVVFWDEQPRGFVVMGAEDDARLTELAGLVIDKVG